MVAATALTAQQIYLSKRGKVLLDADGGVCQPEVVASLARNFETCGYTVSRELFERLAACSPERVTAFGKQALRVLRKLRGAGRPFRPMYPNFPRQVMELSDLQLYLNAMLHYWGSAVSDLVGDPSLVTLPASVEERRGPLPPPTDLQPIGLGTAEDFDAIFTQLAGANSSLPASDKEVLRWFCTERAADVPALLPNTIPQRETRALLAGWLGLPDSLAPLLTTATDVLRVAVALSEGDVSLAAPPRFKKVSRAARRRLLQYLENCESLTEDMLRFKGYWIRLGEVLHPGEYKGRFPRAFAAFDVLRNDKPFLTFNGRVERALADKDGATAAELLRARPGVFARRLDHLLRTDPRPETVDAFLAVADQAATPLLLQVWHHFGHRDTASPRAFFPKGDVGKVQVVPNNLPPLPADLTGRVAGGVRNVLLARFRTLPPLGTVFVDERLKDHPLPAARRSASKALRTLARGAKLDLPPAETVRFFLWWKNGTGRTDIDLSAVFLGDGYERLGQVAYYDLKAFGCCHSGDITSAPNGACEFIDLDLGALVGAGVRYAVMCLTGFTEQPFCDLPECFAGWMARTAPQSGEVFDARTVRDKVDLAADTTVAIPVVIDVAARRVVWADLALKSSRVINNVGSNGANVSRVAQAVVGLRRPTLYDLFAMHAEARGRRADGPDADTVFALDRGVTPFDADRVLSEFLP